MDIKHTAEPWVLFEDKSRVGVDLYIKANADAVPFVAEMLTGTADYDSNFDIERSTMYANAKRIVACVNACSRISDEELHEADLWQRFHSLSNVIVNVTQQRDELLEALKKAQSFISEINNAGGKYAGLHGDVVRDSYAENNAAIEVIESIEGKF